MLLQNDLQDAIDERLWIWTVASIGAGADVLVWC